MKKVAIFSTIGGVLLVGIITLIIILCLPKGKAYRTIKVFKTEGTVVVSRDNKEFDAKENMSLKSNDKLLVKEGAKTILKLDNDKFISVMENTTLTLVAEGKKNNTKTKILVSEGGVTVELKSKINKDTESFEIASSNSVMAIRGTKIRFLVSLINNQTKTELSLLEGQTDVYFFKDNKLNKAIFEDTLTKLTYTSDSSTIEKISELIDNKENIQTITKDDMVNTFNVVVEEMTSAEIDSIVDDVNGFDRDNDQLNGTIKFLNNVSELAYGTNPVTAFQPDKEYNGIKYYYTSNLADEFVLFDENTYLDAGSTWYFKAISDDAYRSDPFMVTMKRGSLNVELKLSQSINTISAVSANVVVSIENDPFFNSDLAKTLDMYSQPTNYIICRVKNDSLEQYILGELNYRNKEVVFDKDLFTNSNGKANVEFEYHFDNYDAINPVEQTYTFETELIADNFICYYNPITTQHYFQLQSGAFYSGDLDVMERFNYLFVQYNTNDPTNGSRKEIDDDEDVHEFVLDDGSSIQDYAVNGVYTLRVKSMTSQADDPKTVVSSTDWFNVDLNNYDTTKPTPYLNLAGTNNVITTFNDDGTINIYVDLQYGIEIYPEEERIPLGDYIVRFNKEDGSAPDQYIRGNGRFLKIENLPMDDYIIKQVYAVDKVVDGITYASNISDNSQYISLRTHDIDLNTYSDANGVYNRLSFSATNITSGTVTIITPDGIETEYSSQDADSANYYKDTEYVYVRATYLISIDKDLFNSMYGEDYITDSYAELNDETLGALKQRLKEQHNFEIKGTSSKEYTFKILFKTVGDEL